MINGLLIDENSTVRDAKLAATQTPPIDFIFFQARNGSKDSQNQSDVRKALTNLVGPDGTVLLGAYTTIAYANNPPSGVVQANDFITLIYNGGNTTHLPLAVYLYYQKIPNSNNFYPITDVNAYLAIANAAIETLHTRMGRWPIIITSPSFLNDVKALGAQYPAYWKNCPLNLVSWSTTMPNLDVWNEAFWDFDHDIAYPGITGDTHKILWPGTRAQLKAWYQDQNSPLPVFTSTTPVCPTGQHWDTTQNKCVDDVVVHTCPTGQHWDDATQSCVADVLVHVCPTGKHWDETKQACVDDVVVPPVSDDAVKLLQSISADVHSIATNFESLRTALGQWTK